MDDDYSYDDSQFYTKAKQYWAKIPATLDGVLGGYANISNIDIEDSKNFLRQLFSMKNGPGRQRALDCGAGIGRITQAVLLPYFKRVDLVEQEKKFLDTAVDGIGFDNPKLGAYYNIGLQSFRPIHSYDVIWCQWVLGHLKDDDLVNFLKQCSHHLNENGVIVIKENITFTNDVEYDDEDSSLTRSHDLMLKIFNEANYKLIKESQQPDFPEELYDVFLFAIRPKENTNEVV